MLLLIDHPYATINRLSMLLLIDHPYVTINRLSMLPLIVHPYATINRSVHVTINRSSLCYY